MFWQLRFFNWRNQAATGAVLVRVLIHAEKASEKLKNHVSGVNNNKQ
jgi:hypothetical protein